MEALYNRLGAPGAKQLYVAAVREGLAVNMKQARDFVARQADTQLFSKTPGSDSQTATRGPRSDFQADLVDLKQFGGNSKVILVVINPFSRKIAMEGLPNKTPAQTQQGFRRILTRMDKPELLSTDQGNEFGGVFNAMLEEKGIAHRYKDPKNVNSLAVLDRAIQTVKITLFKKMTRKNTLKWDSFIAETEAGYNESIHGALQGAPNDTEGTSETAKIARFQLMKDNAEKFESNHEIANTKMNAVREGGQYRVALKQETFQRGFKPRFESAVSTVKDVKAGMVTSTAGKTVPVTAVKVVPVGTADQPVPDFRGDALRKERLRVDLRQFALELHDALGAETIALTAAARLMGDDFKAAKPSSMLMGQFLALCPQLFVVSGEGPAKTVRRVVRRRLRGKQG